MMKFFISAALFYGVLCLLVYLYQKNLLFFPDRTPLGQCSGLRTLGGFHYESEDKKTRLYHIPTPHASPKGWILHFHGNGGRACDRIETSRPLLDLGYHLILSEYPGYSEEAPLPSAEEILVAANNSYNYIADKNQAQLPIIPFGESLGTGPATYLASQNLMNISALILQTPFPSLGEVGQAHYFYLPVKLLLTHDFPAAKWAKEVKIPVFAFHGDQDEIIPFKIGKKQVEHFSPELVTFWEVQGAHHNDLLFFAGSELWHRIGKFLDTHQLRQP